MIAVSEGGFIDGGVGLCRVAGGTIEFAGNTKFIFKLLCCAGPPCQVALTIPAFVLVGSAADMIRAGGRGDVPRAARRRYKMCCCGLV